ncbi:MAG: TIGR00730 family Rossman fold protein [bacterium]
MERDFRRVCVYAASSRQTDSRYTDAARELGRLLAGEGIGIVYGGGRVGSMGALAEGALEADGKVLGVIPRFMMEVGWGHSGISELRVVDDIHIRKRTMLELSDAVVALPGASGTLEELLEAITWKRLGLYTSPVVMVSVDGFYEPLVRMLEQTVEERFMDPRHLDMWSVAERVEDVLPALRQAPPWDPDALDFAAI